MRETILRIVKSKKEKDPIHHVVRRQADRCTFHCELRPGETLLQEEVDCGIIYSIRIRQLSNPPPDLALTESYNTVRKIEISCPVDVSWIFSICASLTNLKMIKFGSSCFEFPYGCCQALNDSCLGVCESVNEIVIGFDDHKLLQPNYELELGIQCIDTILDYCTWYFPCLSKADLFLPQSSRLDEFLENNPNLTKAGKKVLYSDKNMVHFRSFAYTNEKVLVELGRRNSSESSASVTLQTSHSTRRPRSDAAKSEVGEDSDEPAEKIVHVSPDPKISHSDVPQSLKLNSSPRKISAKALNQSSCKGDLQCSRNIPETPTPEKISVSPVISAFCEMFTRRCE